MDVGNINTYTSNGGTRSKRSSLEIRDSLEKIIVVRDRILPWRDENGILIMGLQDFLETWDREK